MGKEERKSIQELQEAVVLIDLSCYPIDLPSRAHTMRWLCRLTEHLVSLGSLNGVGMDSIPGSTGFQSK